jgi:hypothetical protein
MTDQYRRDVRGRFTRVDTSNTALSADSRFDVMRELDITVQGADPRDLAYDSVPRYAPAADELAQGYGPVMHRPAVLVPPEDTASTVYSGHTQGWVTRAAARASTDPMDATPWLTGADDGLSPEARAEVLARQQMPAQVRRIADGR